MITMPKITSLSYQEGIDYLGESKKTQFVKYFNLPLMQGDSDVLPCTKQFASAFTLIELLVALLVTAIVLMVAVPSFQTTLMNGKLSASTNALVNALNFARSKALYQASNMIVCPFSSAGSTTCGGSWRSGWIVVSVPASGASTLLLSQQYSSTDPTLSSNIASVTFDAHGLATTQSNFKLCDSRGGAYARSVQVQATGFIQVGSTPGQAAWDNTALTCP